MITQAVSAVARALGLDEPTRIVLSSSQLIEGDQLESPNLMSHFVNHDSALATDLYELTMAAAYFDNEEKSDASFELFVRDFPKNRSYLVAAGLEQAIEYLTNLRFSAKHVEYLKRHPSFKNVSRAFFDYLLNFKFNGDVWAIPEGTVFFTDEPVMRVTAPIIEAQIVETYLLSTINFETLIATKASRVVQTAKGRGVVEFGSRRAHGPEAALLAARASYIGGCIGTSNVLAGYLFGIPTYGTMAHSFIMSYDSEEEAFKRFCKVFPSSPAFLIDTYDTVEGAKKAVSLNVIPSLVRLDSGDRYKLSFQVRKILDEAGFKETIVFASGDLNEFILDDLTSRGAPIDMFGVGTELVTSRDDPALSGIYKLVSLHRNGKRIYRVKTSAGKRTIPGAKQIHRTYSDAGEIQEDLLALEDEEAPFRSEQLLIQVLDQGRLGHELPMIRDIQGRARKQVASLPMKYRALAGSEKPPVKLSPKLQELANSMWISHGESRET
jgi:nicotinate phosphoribosyltransferase